MSNATNQTLLLLSMVNGALKILEFEDILCESTRATSYYAGDLVEALIHRYPASGDEQKNYRWMHEHLQEWSGLVDDTGKTWNPIVLVELSLNILSDLADKIKNIDVLFDIKDLREAMKALSAEMGKETSDEFILLDEANCLLEQMYRLIGFER